MPTKKSPRESAAAWSKAPREQKFPCGGTQRPQKQTELIRANCLGSSWSPYVLDWLGTTWCPIGRDLESGCRTGLFDMEELARPHFADFFDLGGTLGTGAAKHKCKIWMAPIQVFAPAMVFEVQKLGESEKLTHNSEPLHSR